MAMPPELEIFVCKNPVFFFNNPCGHNEKDTAKQKTQLDKPKYHIYGKKKCFAVRLWTAYNLNKFSSLIFLITK